MARPRLAPATLTGGVATLSSVSLTATSTLTATYEGDTNYTGSTSAALTVPLVQTSTTTVTTSPNPSVVGQSVTLAAAVATSGAVPTGDVDVPEQWDPPRHGHARQHRLRRPDGTTLPAGSDSITAQYSGDSNYSAGTSAAVTQIVSQASSTTTLTVAPLVSSAGQSVTLSVNVAATSAGAVIPTGTVTFLSGSTTLGTATLDANGNASLVTSDASGRHEYDHGAVLGRFQLHRQHLGRRDPDRQRGRRRPASTITLTASTTNPSAFSSVQFTATVAPAGTTTTTPTGTVVFFANGAMIGSATLDTNGNATFSTSDLAVGSETIMAVYQGDSNYSGSTTAPLAITVGTGDELFVNQMYLIILDRPAEQAGLTAWTTDLQDGFSRQQVVRLIIDSPEAQADAQVRAESSTGTQQPHLTAQLEPAVQDATDQRPLRGDPRPSGRPGGTSILHQCRERWFRRQDDQDRPPRFRRILLGYHRRDCWRSRRRRCRKGPHQPDARARASGQGRSPRSRGGLEDARPTSVHLLRSNVFKDEERRDVRAMPIG